METKTCIACEQDLPLNAFGKYTRSKDGLQSKCKTCKRAYDRERHHANLEHNKQRKKRHTKLRRQRIYQYIIDYLTTHPCTECGESDIRCLEFDHIKPDDKHMNVSDMIVGDYGLESIKSEISKCRVLCANCHAKHSSKQRNDYKHRHITKSEWEESNFH